MKVGILPRIGIALLVAFVLGMVGGILESNLVQGDYKEKFGTVPVPGSKVLHLPAKTIDVAYAVLLPGRGNETPDVPVPRNLELSVVPSEPGAPRAIVRDDVGASSNSVAADTDTDIRLWTVEIQEEGDYRVTARGGSPLAVNPTLEVGTGPLVPIGYVWLGALIVGILAGIFWPQIVAARRRRRAPAKATPTAPDRADGDTRFRDIQSRLDELEDLHARGVLSDADYEAEQARLIDGI
jgi:hypothetical protein